LTNAKNTQHTIACISDTYICVYIHCRYRANLKTHYTQTHGW